jgi:hypothetical protein
MYSKRESSASTRFGAQNGHCRADVSSALGRAAKAALEHCQPVNEDWRLEIGRNGQPNTVLSLQSFEQLPSLPLLCLHDNFDKKREE